MTGFCLATWAFRSQAHVREAVELRRSVADAIALAREASADASERDRRDRSRDERIFRVTVAMAIVAGLTLLAAIATLIASVS